MITLRLKILSIIIFVLPCFLYAQPYYFYDDNYGTEIWKVNLQNGERQLFLRDTTKEIDEVSWDASQEWIYVWYTINRKAWPKKPYYNLVDIIKITDTSVKHTFPDVGSFTDIPSPIYRNRVHDGVIYNKGINRFYVIWTTSCDTIELDSFGKATHYWNERGLRIGVYDASTFVLVDSFKMDEHWLASTASVLEDGSKMYVERWDYQEPKEIGIFSLPEKKVIKRKKIGDISVSKENKSLRNNKSGIFLIGYIYPGENDINRKIVVYDITKDSILSMISFPPVCKSYLSGNAKYVILEETPINPNSTSIQDLYFYPGKISIYEALTGKLVQKLNLQQDGRILIFDNYPNILYYYLPKEERSINISLSKLATIQSITPSFAYAGGEGFALTITGQNFIHGSTVNWNGSQRATTFISDSVLEANISASDISATDSVLITVKSPDGMLESNGIMFYILKREEGSVVALLDTLLARLKWCYDTKQLGERKFYAELDDHIKDAIKKYQRQDTIGCAQEIEAFYTKLRWEYQRKPKKNDRRYVSEQAYQMLYPLARQIEAKVITLPPKPTGTLMEQISALKSQIKTEAQSGNIGGERLIRSLEKILDRAIREIQKGDTIQARIYTKLFMQTVREVYEYTIRHANARTYVKAEGYISLYYRCRYTLESMWKGIEPTVEVNENIQELELQIEREEGEYKELLQEIKE